MHVVVYPEAEVPADLRRQQVALQDLAWPSEHPSEPIPWHDPALQPESMLLVDEDRVVAALDILSKELEHAGQRFAASGVSAVVADPDRRGEGHGTTLVVAARERIAAGGADLGIFTCDRALLSFYQRAGWRHLAGTVVIGGTPEVPLPSDELDKVTMGAFFSPRARQAASSFLGARIELYPGEIDKLW